MDMFKECRAYLADNPKGYWFRRKQYGYGWMPARKQGWLLTGFYLLFVIVLLIASSPNYALIDADEFIVPVVVATLLYVAIVWKTGEPLKWQWGPKKDSDQVKQ